MKKDYIEIAGRRYRVEVNWNALTSFLRAVGRDTIDELSRIETLRPSELTALMSACMEEGERLEGRDGVPGPMDLGAVITPDDVREFIEIYVRQSNPQKTQEEEPKKEAREEHPAP